MKNLILSAAFGLEINQIDFFIKSLRKYYNDDIYLLIGPNDLELKDKLSSFNCKFIVENIHKHSIQVKRYKIFSEILSERKFNKILCCDSRDIYFQSNPFDYNYKGQINFFLEDQKIKNCPFNSNWIIKSYGNKIFNNLSEKTIICSGTVLATGEKMLEYLNILIKQIKEVKYKKSLKYLLTFRRDKNGRGVDQGHCNYIAHNKLIKGSYFYSNNEGPIATVYYLEQILFDEKSRLINKIGEPYSVVHQYDKRWGDFSKEVSKLKKDLDIRF